MLHYDTIGCRVTRTSRAVMCVSTETRKNVTNHRGQSQNKQSGFERTCPTCEWLCAISSRARSQIITKPSQRFGTPTVECPRGGNVRKYATAEECMAKNQKTTVRHFGFTKKVYGLPCTVRTLLVWKRHLEMPSWELT